VCIATSEWVLLISQISGILLLLSTIVLLWFRRIYIDAQTRQPTEVDIPLLGKFRTQAPAIALILVAAILVIYPISRSKPDLIKIEGAVDTGGKSVTVLVVALPNSLTTLDSAGTFEMPVPLIENVNYRVKFIIDKQVVGESPAKPDTKKLYRVADFRWVPPITNDVRQVKTTREGLTDEQIHRLGIH
jgi:hypothetical protein